MPDIGSGELVAFDRSSVEFFVTRSEKIKVVANPANINTYKIFL